MNKKTGTLVILAVVALLLVSLFAGVVFAQDNAGQSSSPSCCGQNNSNACCGGQGAWVGNTVAPQAGCCGR
jgi:hypothetical protein